MVVTLCTRYGPRLCEVSGTPIHAFPPVAALARPGVAEELQKLGFGYRARFIHLTARRLAGDGADRAASVLHALRHAPYRDAKARLMELDGVGPKVADCICLMSLDKHDAIPVDTHVWAITKRHYLPHVRKPAPAAGRRPPAARDLLTPHSPARQLVGKSLTPRIYDQIGDFYRSRFGPLAGWAHSVLFSADLRRFRDRLLPDTEAPRGADTAASGAKRAGPAPRRRVRGRSAAVS